MEMGDHEEFRNKFRMSVDVFHVLLEKVRPLIEKKDTIMRPSVTAKVRLMITLRYLVTGSNFRALEDSFRVSYSTISRIVPEVCDAIWSVLSPEYMKCPSSPGEWKKKADTFGERWNYNRALGAIDGKHICVQAFNKSGSVYRNYKSFFSIVLLALVGPDYEVLLSIINT
jgi:hypothetical protein